jgi:iron complex transport system permease protein
MKPKHKFILLVLFVVLLISVIAGLLAGYTSPREIIDDPERGMLVLLKLRLPRVLLGIFVGAALAVAGAAFQGILRNPLATPYTLGVAGGASLGAYIVILSTGATLMSHQWFHLAFVPIGAFIGGLLTVSLVYGLARRRGKVNSYSLILAGVVINFTFASVILFLHYIANFTEVYTMVHWMMGSLGVVGFSKLYLAIPVIAICLIAIFSSHRSFDILAFGEVTAHSMGLDVERFIKWIFIVVSIMIGMCVSVCGPIGFVGLVIPHILRLAFGGRHSFILPASVLAGGAFLCFADALGRVVVSPRELPVGILTALIGGPILAVLLMRGGGYEVRD